MLRTISKKGATAVELLRERGPRGAAGYTLERLNEGLYGAADRCFDRFHGIESVQRVHAAELTIAGPNTNFGVDPMVYVGAPVLALWRSFRYLPSDARGWSFVDYGSGKGRVLVFAARRPFDRVIGIEFARELHDQSLDNLARAGRHLRAGLVDVRLEDAADSGLPSGPLVLFFFNPFEPPVMAQVLANVEETLAAEPRPAIAITHGNVPHDMFESLKGFRQIATGGEVAGVGPPAGYRVYENVAPSQTPSY